MLQASKGAPPQWLSTHPSGEARIREIESRLPGVRADLCRCAEAAAEVRPAAEGQQQRHRLTADSPARSAPPPMEGTRPVALVFPPAGRWCRGGAATTICRIATPPPGARMNATLSLPSRSMRMHGPAHEPSRVMTPLHELALLPLIEDRAPEADARVQPLWLVRFQPGARRRAAGDRVRRRAAGRSAAAAGLNPAALAPACLAQMQFVGVA